MKELKSNPSLYCFDIYYVRVIRVIRGCIKKIVVNFGSLVAHSGAPLAHFGESVAQSGAFWARRGAPNHQKIKAKTHFCSKNKENTLFNEGVQKLPEMDFTGCWLPWSATIGCFPGGETSAGKW